MTAPSYNPSPRRLVLADELKPNAAATVAGMRRLGLRPILLTGDNKRAARTVADRLGIATHDVLAEVPPEGKLAAVERLQAAGAVVALPAAAIGCLDPMFAGAAMPTNSVFVVTNSLRLRLFHRRSGWPRAIAADPWHEPSRATEAIVGTHLSIDPVPPRG